MNKPGSGRWSPADHQEAQTLHHHLQHGQQVAAALDSHTTTVIFLQGF